MECTELYSNSDACSLSTTDNPQSHRRRRVGAARGRLAKAKEAAKSIPISKHGWHESMEAASMAAQRKWGREKGWEHYQEAGDDHGLCDNSGASSVEKIRIPLQVAKGPGRKEGSSGTLDLHCKEKDMKGKDVGFPVGREDPSFACGSKHSTQGHSETGNSYPLGNNKAVISRPVCSNDSLHQGTSPVPPDIHRICQSTDAGERSARTMLTTTRSEQRHPISGSISSDYSIVRKEESDQLRFGPPSRTKSNQWVQSMERATANLAEHGHSWDPRHGFANLDASDVMSIRSPVPTLESNTGHRQIAEKNPSPPAATKFVAERCRGDPPGKSAKETNSNALVTGSERTCTEPLEPKLLNLVNSDRGVEIEASFSLAGINDAIEAHDCNSSALNLEEDADYMLPSPGAMPYAAVIKERVSLEEFGLFPKNPRRSLHRLPMMAATDRITPGTTDLKSGERKGGCLPADTDEAEGLPLVSPKGLENDLFLQGFRSPDRQKQQKQRPTRPPHNRSPGVMPDLMGTMSSPIDAAKPRLVRCNVGDMDTPAADVGTGNTDRVVSSTVAGSRTWANPGANDVGGLESDSAADERGDPSDLTSLRKKGVIPWEIGSFDASQASVPSSVTAGWKSFLAKKVRAENEAAELRRRDQAIVLEEKPEKEAIKKSVSFASDSLRLSDSLVDSLFDFSATESNDNSAKYQDVIRRDKAVHSPRRWNGSRARLAAPQYREHMLSRDEGSQCQPAVTSQTGSGQVGLNKPFYRSPHQMQSGSFEELMDMDMNMSSPTQYESEETDDQVGIEDSFLQRLTHCRASNACTSKRVQRRDKEKSVSHQWYLHSKQASKIVEEMIHSLRSQRQVSNCESRDRSTNLDSPTGSNAGINSHTDLESKEAERDALDLARARVDAMVETLYYAS